jgi:hypothetical protein
VLGACAIFKPSNHAIHFKNLYTSTWNSTFFSRTIVLAGRLPVYGKVDYKVERRMTMVVVLMSN